MKARYDGRCSGCGDQISPTDEISILLGKWLHMTCKNQVLATRTAAAGPAVEIPYEEPEETAPQVTGTKTLNRRSYRRLHRRP
jgi:hypothetical protein